jgi:ankyrin repeat protein
MGSVRYKVMCSIAILAVFLASCMNVNVSTGSYPPFIQAASEGNIEEAERLIRRGEFPSQTTIGNQTALHVAAAEGQDQMVKWLLAREADPLAEDQNGQTAEDFARKQGHSETANILRDYALLVPAEQAAFASGDIDSLREMMATDFREYTVLHAIAQGGTIDLARAELEMGANVNARNALELTPLHKAVVGGQLDIARLLIDEGADIDAVDVWNNSPLYYAVLWERPEFIRLFLENNASVDIRSTLLDETPIDYAERKNNAEIMAIILQYGEIE